MDIISVIASELKVGRWQVEAAVGLIDEGNTIPFIARYRKEKTGELNDEQLRTLFDRLGYLRNLEDRKNTVLTAIEGQGKLTEELKAKILAAPTMVAVEDLYRPFVQSKRTKGSIAKEKGLEPLADYIQAQEATAPLLAEAEKYVDPEKKVESAKDALAGARDILIERISVEPSYRETIRDMTMAQGIIKTKAKEEETESVYEMYYDYEAPVSGMAGHRTLAINRGEKEKILTVKILAPEEQILSYLQGKIITSDNEYTTPMMEAAIKEAYSKHIGPAIEREIRNALTEEAQEGAIKVFGKNLTQLLMQPPITGQTVLGWDPGYRTGCKLAVVDPTGKVLDTAVVHCTIPDDSRIERAKEKVRELIRKYHVTLVSVGNGTASRESEQVIVGILSEYPGRSIHYVITNEAGASVYSASRLATEEFPAFDVGQRSAASIARRVQDPLAELVKIDPQSIGVGQYQHDMNQKKLGEALGGVVEDCVNKVGVDLNTASPSLLQYVSGISKMIATNIVAYRESNGAFKSRQELLKVPKLGPKAFEQCAGFLRIRGGANPLDNTGVHPESYEAAKALLASLGYTLEDVETGSLSSLHNQNFNYEDLSKELQIGAPTLRDIVKELEKPGRDPRDEMPRPILRTDVLEMKDLKTGMVLKGTVRNVVDFGAFVDIGVHRDGLVHISEMSHTRLSSPLDMVSVGDIVDVMVLDVDEKKGRLSLSMKALQPKPERPEKRGNEGWKRQGQRMERPENRTARNAQSIRGKRN